MRKARIGQRVLETRKNHFKKSGTGGLVLAGLTIGTLVLMLFATGSMGQGRDQGGSKSERFDLSVREDFFSGFAGDTEALTRGMKKCGQALAKDPKNAEALVWHGSGLSYEAKRAFMAGDVEKGRQIQAQAAKEMNDAVTMRPDDASVLIPRGSIFLSAALHVPSPEVAKKDFQIAADDYEKVLRLQTPVFSKLSVHSRGELLGGLAEAWNGLGNTEKSRGYLQRMMEEFPDTSYSRRAKEVLSTAPKPGALGTTCLGCHVGAAP
jgi:tetratricopeptide (TPR) repeat protein